ncbi:MAG: ATP phosphoribosyltransferase regulatory subunit [Bacillota bacterium]
MFKFRLPEGVQDYLPDLLYNKKIIEKKLMSVFTSNAYKQIQTPKLEYYELFSGGVGAVSNNKLFKINDTDGSLLVLRADMTLPIARIVSTKMQLDFPLRLCYLSDSFNFISERNRMREFTQAGIELYGVPGSEGDAEVIALAIKALLNAGLTDFQIDIGQVDILKGILNEANISEDKQKEIISAVDKKNFIDSDIDPEVAKKIDKITMLYGDITVLKEASELVTNKTSVDALLGLFEIHQILAEYKLDKYISFDLGLVNSFSYYSGVVFKGITKHFGAPILGGGRYDKLCQAFKRNIPATGFAIGIRDLMQALQKSGMEIERQLTDLVIGVCDNYTALAAARKIADSAIDKGLIVDLVYKTNKELTKKYAQKKGIENALFINSKGKIEED